ncbi:MAG TPA: chromosomal replication initiator protein DnaA [Ktedonobacterales bacterium]|nr:chromosomal replication initiator protein DnaA [Ktedonobacterales bacterium]
MNAKQLWQSALDRVAVRVSPASYTTWFKPTEGLDLSGATLSVYVPNTFACQHLRQRFADVAARAASEVFGGPLAVIFTASRPERTLPGEPAPVMERVRPRPGSPAARRPTRRTRQALLEAPIVAPSGARAAVAQPPLPQPAPLAPATSAGHTALAPAAPAPAVAFSHPAEATDADPGGRHVFETYVVGTANRLAYTAARQVAERPGQSYNPLFIYGGTGLGKTHLLLAIARVARRGGLRACYVTAERFANDIIEAIRHHTTAEFRAHYRAVDVLLVDDIHFIAGKESTEEEFFHTFNTLHDANRQIVLSSDRTPKAMHHLHDRLRSRFEWGLLADIQLPDFEQRLEILRVKARTLGIAATEAVLAAVARPEGQSVRALEGALNRVAAYAAMLGQPLGLETVRQALRPLEEPGAREVSPERVVAAVAQHFGVTAEALRGKGRDHAIVWPRQVAMYLLREETPASLSQIGQHLGGRDHRTILHGCNQVTAKLAASDPTRRELDELRAAIRG